MEELPRQLKKREAKKTTDLVKWVNQNIKQSCIVEVKQTNTNTLYANSIKDHQIATLKQSIVTWKPSDAIMQRQKGDILHFYKPINYIIIIFGDNTKIIIEAFNFPDHTKKITKAECLKIGKEII